MGDNSHPDYMNHHCVGPAGSVLERSFPEDHPAAARREVENRASGLPSRSLCHVLSTISCIGLDVGRTLILPGTFRALPDRGDVLDKRASRGGIELDTADRITILGISVAILVITGFLVGLLF